jgi:catechol 2,3-dioxygenase-like lactoylglutathione lyase family enzyme
MNRIGKASALVLGGLSVAAIYSVSAGREPHRPHIWRIAQVTLLSTDVPAARDFYEKLLPTSHIACVGCAKVPNNAFMVGSTQTVYLSQVSSPGPANLLLSIAFATDDLNELRHYLVAQGVECSPPAAEKLADRVLSVRDPEKHNILFLKQPHYLELRLPPGTEEKLHIIHAGFIVHDRTAAEHFYKDILGFRPYWHGGMKDDQTDWVSMQVPDGTDWLEFMVNVSPDADQRLRGIMNHIAIGVTDIHATEKRLRAAGLKFPEEPKIGRDGKWQLNLYDPDDTRVELMEFTPVQKPCCSEYTGPHPKP